MTTGESIHGGLPGERNSNAKLTDEQVLDGRRRYAAGESLLGLAAEWGVSFAAAQRVVNGAGWAHLPRPKAVLVFGLGLCECGCGRSTSLARTTNRRLGHRAGEPVRFVQGHHARKRGAT